MLSIVDYGVGNLFSLRSSFRYIGVDAVVSGDPDEILKSDRIILPGVGAFGDAAEKLRRSGLHDTVLEAAKRGIPTMGICLGMQLLFEKSYEYGEHDGLSLLKGSVVSMEGRLPQELKIPHIGWNALNKTRDSRLLKYVNPGDCVYFVHSYYAEGCDDSLIATAEYGRNLTAAVEKDNLFGCQFHPEKSGPVGLNILRAFCEVSL